ncbi:putative sexual development protein [Phaeomoniella chlamydospora]|uniref:Putative sexual development protein n=1 Tax=Phaeomoniella chlamydospora TaxID=158046 RepID=A0A0G2EKH8_PHACM|nr:putative sexual development protein [Phaeomoniella chlamydospora]
MSLPAMLNAYLCASVIALANLAAGAPCSETVAIAGGGPPDSEIPAVLSTNAAKELQLALFLENLEVSFFNMGLTNFTESNANGYPNDTLQVVKKVAAQEVVHVESLINLLDDYGIPTIPPCNYSFSVNSTKTFLDLAHMIGSVGIGATIGLTERLAATDPLLVKTLSSILTVESRHDAFFRSVNGEVPNPTPFDTGISGLWAYNLALSFVVSGSCPVELPLPILPGLTVTQPTSVSYTKRSEAPYANITQSPPQLEFTWDPSQAPFAAESGKQLLIGWVNQLNVPVYTPVNTTATGKGTTYIPRGMNGVAFAVLTSQVFENVNDLAFGTIAGPAFVALS